MFQPHTLVTIQLSADNWNKVLKQLGKGRHVKVIQLINEIQQQALAQQQTQQQGPQVEPEVEEKMAAERQQVPSTPIPSRRNGQLRPADEAPPNSAA